MRTPRKIFPVPLSRPEKRKLAHLAVASGIPMCGMLRLLLLREFADTRRGRTASHEQPVGGGQP